MSDENVKVLSEAFPGVVTAPVSHAVYPDDKFKTICKII